MKVLLAPVVSEKSTFVADKNNQYVFRVAAGRDQAGDQGGGRAHVQDQVKSSARAGAQREGQGKALRPLHGPPQQLEEGLRVRSKPGQEINFAATGRTNHATGQSQTDLAGPPRARQGRQPGAAQGRARRSAASSAESKTAGRNNTRPHHHAPPGRRPQAALPHHRLQAQQGRHRGEGRASGTRSEPQRASRAAAATPTASAVTSSRRRA